MSKLKIALIAAAVLFCGTDVALVAYQAGHSVPAVVQVAAPVAVAAPVPVKGRDPYLAALRTRMPVSVAGDSETLIAVGVCRQLALGTPEGSLISDLNAMWAPLYGVDAVYYAQATVGAARDYYCL